MLRNALNQGKRFPPGVLWLDSQAYTRCGSYLTRHYGGGNQHFLPRSDETSRRWDRYDRRADGLDEDSRDRSYSRHGAGRDDAKSYYSGRRDLDRTGHRNSFRPYKEYNFNDRHQDRSRETEYQPFKRRTWVRRPIVNAPTSLSDPDALIRAIRTAFPHVKNPTSIQSKLIPAIHRGEDIILQDETGSGKTFGSVLALLSETQRSHLGITTLYIVPHRELAYQIESWCQKLLPEGSTTDTLATHVQVLARPDVNSALALIKQTHPRILITTPGALVEAMTHPTRPLKLHLSLQRIIVDEVDVVMNIPPRYRVVRESRRHRAEAAQAIDRILEDIWRLKRPKPQMVMMGATLWTHVRKWLFSQNGWMAERVLRLDGVKAERDQDDGFVSSSNDKVLHSAIAVQSDGTLRNVEISDEDESMMEPGILTHKPSLVLEAISDDEVTQSDAYAYSGDAAHEASDPGPSVSPTSAKPTIPPSVFEAIATSVALDVTNRAMCVIPAGISVGPVVENFRKLGVDARLLNLRDEIEHISRSSDEDTSIDSPSVTNTPSLASSDCQKSLVPAVDGVGESGIESPNPVLLITTTSSVRGLDIPTLSHIYIIGGMNSSAVYRHVAGRVGRFGMPGTVVSFVGVAGSENVVGISGGERKLRNIYKQIGAKVVPFAHIQ